LFRRQGKCPPERQAPEARFAAVRTAFPLAVLFAEGFFEDVAAVLLDEVDFLTAGVRSTILRSRGYATGTATNIPASGI
jgi:hypothetical protein